MQEEQMKVLDMIASGKITPQEGASLLEALGSGGTGKGESAYPRWEWFLHHPHWGEHPRGEWGEKGRMLRIRVADSKTEQLLVNLSLPIGLLKWRAKIGKSLSRKFKNVFFDVENIDEHVEGKIVEATDENSGKKVEIWLE
ncbi:MAG: hypothetical protein ABSC17_04865 [Thermacetogeniaceae bacterium]